MATRKTLVQKENSFTALKRLYQRRCTAPKIVPWPLLGLQPFACTKFCTICSKMGQINANVLGLKLGTLCRRIVLPSSSRVLASMKLTKMAQIIVPDNAQCSRIVSWQSEHQRSSTYQGLLNSAEGCPTLKKRKEIKILCIRSSVIKRKTFSIGSTSCCKGNKTLHRPITSYVQVCVQWNCQCLSCK